MSNQLIFMEKPDHVSWDDIHKVLWEAHESTRKQGLFYPTAEMSGEELREFLSKHNGRCLVAMDKDTVVGTMSYYVEDVNTRLFKGKFLKLALTGNLPAYKGKGIFSSLYNMCHAYAKAEGLDGITYGTAEKNRTMRNIFQNKGFIDYRCHYSPEKKRFVVGGIYCFDKLPHKKGYYTLIFKCKNAILHLRYANWRKS